MWDSPDLVRSYSGDSQEIVRSLLAAAVSSQYPAQREAATSHLTPHSTVSNVSLKFLVWKYFENLNFNK